MPGKDIILLNVSEARLQAAIAADLERRVAAGEPFLYAASLEGVRLAPRKAAECRAQGMKAGEPDLRLYFATGRLVFVELKAAKGSLNPSQRERIPRLRELGFTVHVVKAASEEEAVQRVGAIVDGELALAAA